MCVGEDGNVGRDDECAPEYIVWVGRAGLVVADETAEMGRDGRGDVDGAKVVFWEEDEDVAGFSFDAHVELAVIVNLDLEIS